MELPTIIRQTLLQMGDDPYRKFQSGLIPNLGHPLLGVRLPQLRRMARDISRREDWRTFVEWQSSDMCHEELLLQGLVIGMARCSFEEQKRATELFVPRIENWAVCDTFCTGLKSMVKKDPEGCWAFVTPYLDSPHEFEVRFATVMLLHYVDCAHLQDIFGYADRFTHAGYYARMAMAWLLSVCFAKMPHDTMEYLCNSRLDSWTYNKALQKIVESQQTSPAVRNAIRSMKRKT